MLRRINMEHDNSIATPGNKAPVFPILLVNFISTLGYSIILPFLVVLVLKFGGNELSYGFLGATYSAFQFIGAPLLGSLSDKYGRRKMLLVSEAGTLAGWLLFLVAIYLPGRQLALHSGFLKIFLNTIPLFLLFVSRAIDGITGGNVSIANAYLADITAKGDSKKNFGKITASSNLGFIIGPALAGLLGATALGVSLPIIAAAVVSFIGILSIFFGLQDFRPAADVAQNEDTHNAGVTRKTSFHTVFSLPYIPYFLIMYFLIFLGFNFFYVAFPVYVVQELKWNMFQLGIFFAVLSGILVIVQGPILSRLSPVIAGSKMIIAGNLMLAIAFVLFSCKSLALLYTGVLFFSFGNGIMWPSFLALLSAAAGPRFQGAVQGFAGSAASVASIIGLVAGAFLYKIFGANIFYLAAAFMIIISLSAYRLVLIEKNLSND